MPLRNDSWFWSVAPEDETLVFVHVYLKVFQMVFRISTMKSNDRHKKLRVCISEVTTYSDMVTWFGLMICCCWKLLSFRNLCWVSHLLGINLSRAWKPLRPRCRLMIISEHFEWHVCFTGEESHSSHQSRGWLTHRHTPDTRIQITHIFCHF